MKNKLLFGSILSLFIGTMIYLLFRTSSLMVFKWLELILIDFSQSDIRKMSMSYAGKIPQWILYSLPDGLWIFSYTCLMLYIWNLKLTSHSIFWICIIPLLAIGSEICQVFRIVSGTFDSMDLLLYILGFATPLILIFKSKHLKSL